MSAPSAPSATGAVAAHGLGEEASAEEAHGSAGPLRTVELTLTGMTCASCANRIERKLNKLDGVSASVNYATEKASVAAPEGVSDNDLVQTVEKAGYGAGVIAPEPQQVAETGNAGEASVENPTVGATPAGCVGASAQAGLDLQERHLAELKQRLIVCAALTVPVIVLAMVPAWQFTNWQWLSLTLAAPVVVWGAWPFHRAAWTNLRHGAATMDTLVSLGVIASFGWSLYALFLGDAGMPGMHHGFDWGARSHGSANIYLEAAAGVTTFILLGRYIEARSKRASGAALRALLDLGAKEVTVLREAAGQVREERIPTRMLSVGDRFVVRPGEKIATDAVVEDGTSAINASMLTGESLPVDVRPGDAVVGACLNTSGRLIVRATSVGAETQLARMAKLVEDAQAGKANVQRLADRISGVFVPIVIGIAIATLIGWWVGTGDVQQAFTAAVAVLVIACPCALGLATPTALMVGTGRGAQLGILIKGPQVLESTRGIDTIVLDKTGTVTSGDMHVARVTVVDEVDRDRLVSYAGAVEAGSEHPLARAITAFAQREGSVPEMPSAASPSVAAVSSAAAPPAVAGPMAPSQEPLRLSDFENVPGLGAHGVLRPGGAASAATRDATNPEFSSPDSQHVVIGRPQLLEQWSMPLPPELDKALTAAQARGATAVAIGWGESARGVIEVADTIKPTSADAVAELRALGLRPVLLTGDNERAARAVASSVGIDDVIAEVMPQDKVDVVRRLQREGKSVAMVGDGVNDAAALAAADLGLAMGTGTDAAIEASDLTLVRGDLRVAADAIRLSRRTLAIIKGNLFWAFAYNVAALPLAALGYLTPMIAGAAMAFSSVFVVLNSLRLRSFSPRHDASGTFESTPDECMPHGSVPHGSVPREATGGSTALNSGDAR